jgi:predicted N-acetyltransferase YhbS
MELDYLADHPEFVPVLAAWHHAEWARYYAAWPLEQVAAELASHTGRCQVPTTFVAVGDGRPLGSASLIVADLDGWEHLSPWLASVFVAPDHRGQGIGKRLVERVAEEATRLGFPAVYLWTPGQRDYYERLGWECVETVRRPLAEVTVMRRLLDGHRY